MSHSPHARRLGALLQQARRRNLVETRQATPIPARPRSRRSFLQLVAAGGLGLATGLPDALRHSPTAHGNDDPATTPRMAIVGAGIAGLNAAYYLKQFGYTATVYEARNRPGGRIRSRTGFVEQDVTLESGGSFIYSDYPEGRIQSGGVGKDVTIELGGSFINTDHEDMRALVDAFGLTLFDRLAHAEQVAEDSLGPVVGYFFDGTSYSEAEIAELLRPMAEQITADADALDADFEATAADLDALSVADYLDLHHDKIPEPFIRTLFTSAMRTEYGVEPEESSALELIWLLPTVDGNRVEVLSGNDEQFIVEGGNDQIIRGLADALEGQIELRKRLTGLTALENGFQLEFNANETVEVDYVIIAIPFPVLRTIPLQVDLPPVLRRFIDEVHLSRNEKVFAGFQKRVWQQPDGFVLEAWSNTGFPVVWDATLRQPDISAGVLTWLLGGDEAEPFSIRELSERGQRLLENLETYVPGVRAAATGQFFKTFWSQSWLIGGGYTTLQPGQYSEFADYFYIESDDPAERQEVHVGNLVFAGEHVSDAFYGYMNGGAETGRLAAELIARLIQEQHGDSGA